MRINATKGRFDLSSFFNKRMSKAILLAKEEWQNEAPPLTIMNIKNMIQSGNSPVRGNGRFATYSPSYKKAIRKGKYPGKTIRPVNLTLSGKMMRSLIHKKTKAGFTIYFTDKLAKIHSQLGAGKSKTIRKVMPGSGESFKKSVTFQSDEIVRKTLFKRFKNII